MVEVFKTDVKDWSQANRLVAQIHRVFTAYRANFDLEDCDRILRVRSINGSVESCHLIDLLRQEGCHAEILPDIVPSKI